MSLSDLIHAIIVFVITAVQTVWLRKKARPTEEKTDQVYHAVNSGRMERIEASLESVKGWSEKHETDDEKRHNENIKRLSAIEEAQREVAQQRDYITELETQLARHDPEFAMKLEARRR